VVFALVTWVPLVIWAMLWRRAFPGELAEPLLQHIGIHARCLVAIPLLIISEAAADRYPRELFPYFLTSGLVHDDAKPKFHGILRSAEKMRDSWMAWGSLLGVTLFMTLAGSYESAHLHDVAWAQVESGGKVSLGFGGWWYLVVVRFMFTFLLLVWAWRLLVCSALLWRISRLDLQLVPTHPDGAGGLGFLQDIPIIFSLVVFAMSVVMASRWEHDVLYHGAQSTSFNILLTVFVAMMFVLFLSPLTFFSRGLRRLKQHSLLDYGALVGQHGRLVQRRWIFGNDIKNTALLQAPELGPVSDTVAMYKVVEDIRIILIGKRSLLAIGLPALLPMLPLWAIDIPLKELVMKLLEALI
jgi:hypothetical protein